MSNLCQTNRHQTNRRGRRGATGEWSGIERTAGIAALAGSRWEEAEAHFLTALRQAESLPHRPERAHTRRFYGQMLLERNGPGDRKQAEEVLRQAAEDYRRMGMPWHQELTASLVR